MEKCGLFLTRVDDPRRKKFKLAFAKAAKLAQEKEGATLFECLDGDGDYVPYTDCDHYCDGPDRPSDEFIESLRLEMFHNLNLLVGPQGYEGCELKMATRHGLVADKGLYKLSFRCYLLGFKIQPRTMGDFIRRRGLGDKKFGHFDTAPYGKTQLLGCVGFSKSEKDRRVLEPYGDGPLESYMIQNLTGEERVLEFLEDTGDDEPIIDSRDSPDFDGQRFAPPWALLERLVMSLSVAKRCALDTYKEWTEVGWALAGVARACKRFSDGFDLWIRFCQLDMSAYLDGPTKAFDVYQYAATSGPQLGWRSLMQWLKEDDPQTHRHILSELQKVDAKEVTSAEDIKIIKEFVMSSFRHSGGLIAGVFVRKYDAERYIIVELNTRSSCNFINDDHEDGALNRIVIGLKTARDKCSHPLCMGKTNVVVDASHYPAGVKAVVARYLKVVQTPEGAVQNFIKERKGTDFPTMDDEELALADPEPLPFGKRYALTRNRFCCVCNCCHDNPENCIIVDQAAKQLMVGCRLNPYKYHPPGGLAIPSTVTNIIIQNANFGNLNQSEPLDDEVFDDLLPIFPDAELNRLVNISLKGYASDIARVFVHLGRDRFGVQSGDKDTWWAWDELEKRWMRSNHKANLFCDEVVAQKYSEVMQWLRENTVDGDKRNKRLQRIEHLLKRLKDRDQHSILSQVAFLLKEEKRQFENRLDADKNLLNFCGQVYDFERLTVRPIEVTDFVSKSTGYPLPDPDLDQQKLVMDFVRSIMPDEAHVEYLLTWLASCLDGWNREETFHVLSGSGRNGKSLLRDLLAPALGSTPETGYFGVVAASLLTKERPSSDRPVADLLHLKGKRLLIASEPEKGQKVNCGFLKFLTGNDPINGRWLNSNAEVSFQPQHSLVLLCNSIPNLDANDEAVWDRSRVLTFPFKFVARPTQAHHRKSDTFLKSKLPGLAPQLMLLLLQYYARYKRHGLEPTPEMINDTQDVRAENDMYGEFISEQCELSGARDDRILYGDLVVRCQAWIKAHPVYSDRKVSEFKATDLRDTMATFIGRKYSTQRPLDEDGRPGMGWSGVRFLSHNEGASSFPDAHAAFVPDE